MAEIITPVSIVDRIASFKRAMTAAELADLLAVARVTVLQQAASGRIPSFKVGTSVRFCPKAVSQWLKQR